LPADVLKSFVITSYNIQWDIDNHVRSLEFIEKCQSDIIILQEVTAEIRTIINGFKDRFPYQYGEGHSHVMIISRFEVQLIEYLEWPGKFAERALHVTCRVLDRHIHLFAIHLQVTRSLYEMELRNHQINLLFDAIKNCKESVMVIGDFNAATGSRALRAIEKKLDLKSSSSLWNYLPTWPAKVGLLGIKLDHFFTSSKLTILDQKLGPKLDSDHRPITAVVYIK
jgi:endonuclease/exonuclease/phosphatase (EEP) superfamily protein YafD